MTGPRQTTVERDAPRSSRRAGQVSVAGRDLRIVVRSELGPHERAWDDLVASSALPTPFLRSWWLRHTAPRDRARFVLVLDGSTLIGGVALEVDRAFGVPRYRVQGHGWLAPDHLDAVADGGRQQEVAIALRTWCRRPGTRIFDLDGITEDSLLADVLPGRVRAAVSTVAPYRDLTRERDGAPGEPRGRARTASSRGRRRLERDGGFHRVVRGEQVDAALERLRSLHADRWGQRSGFLHLYEPFAAAAREGARRGEVIVHELVADDVVHASLVEFWLADRASFYQHGHDPDGPIRSAGTVTMGYALEHAVRSGATEYDLLRGTEGYKHDWADDERRLIRLQAAHGRMGHLALTALSVKERLGAIKGRARRRGTELVQRWVSALVEAASGAHALLAGRGGSASAVTTVIDDPRRLEPLRDAWARLEAEPKAPNCELDHVIATAEQLGDDERLHVVTVSRDDRLVGVAPLVRTSGAPPWLRCLDSCNAGSFLYADEDGLTRLVDAVLAQGHPLDLDALVAGSPSDEILRARAARWYVHRRPRAGGPSLTIDETWTDPLGKLKRSRRKDLERSMRRAYDHADHVAFELDRSDDIEGCFEELVEVEARSWKGAAGTALAHDDRQREALRRYLSAPAVRDRVRFLRMRIGETTAAIDVSVVIDGRYWGLKGGVDDTFRACAPGLQLRVANLRAAAEEGLEGFEFMGETAPWKEMWGAGPTPLHHLRLYPRNLRGALALARDAGDRTRRRATTGLEQARAWVRRFGPSRPYGSIRRAARAALRHPGVDVPVDDRLAVRVVEDVDGLEALRPGWERLHADVPGPSSHLDWILAYVRTLPRNERGCVLTLHDRDRLTGVAPLVRTTGPAARIRLILLGASGFLYRDPQEAGRLVNAVLGLRHPISLDLLVEGTPTQRRLARSSSRRLSVVAHRAGGPAIRLDDRWKDPLSQLSRNHRKDLRRRARRAEELGEVSFDLIAPGDDVDRLEALFERFVELESSGWKGRRGSALACDERKRDMMWQHISAEAVRHQVRIATMRIDDQLVAMDIDWFDRGRWWAGKTAYDERYASVAPGRLLEAYVVARATEAGASAYEFGGDYEPYKARWGAPTDLVSVKLYPVTFSGGVAVLRDGTARIRRLLLRRIRGLVGPRKVATEASRDEGTPAGRPEILRTPAEVEGLRDGWGALRTEVPGPSSQLDHLIALARHLPDGEQLHVVTVRDGGRLTGVAPLVRSAQRPRRLRLASRGEAMEFLYTDRAQLGRLVDAVLAVGAPLWLDTLPAGSPTHAVLEERARRGALVVSRTRDGGPTLQLGAELAEPLGRVSSQKRRDLRRRLRKAEEVGTVEFDVVPGGEELEALFDEFLRVEGSGWKGREGTALVHDHAQRELFREYLAAEAVRDHVRFARLRIGGETVAMDLAVLADGRYWYLKGGYDERYAPYSPGVLLKAYLVGWAARAGLDRFEFMGDTAPYKEVWGSEPRQLCSLRTYPFGPTGAASLALDAVSKAVRVVTRGVRSRVDRLRS